MRGNVVDRLESMMGTETIIGDWRTITQEHINQFSASGGEMDWLHNDPVRCAKESPFNKKTIVQGNLLLSLHTALAESISENNDEFLYGLNYGYDKVRIIQPVTVDSQVRSVIRLKETIIKGDNVCIAKCDVVTEIKGVIKPALIAEWLFFVQLKPSE